jgi:hypothetical protein
VVGWRGALALVVGVLLTPGLAQASGTLDQSQTLDAGSAVTILGQNDLYSAESATQTFTAGLTGGLDRVDLLLAPARSSPTVPLTVEIRDSSDGLPGSTVLATGSVPAGSVTRSPQWVEVDFASPAPVTSGTQYAIVAYIGGTSRNGYVWRGAGDVYSGGAPSFSFASPPTTWIRGVGFDLAFKTYVSPAASGLAGQLVTDAYHDNPGDALANKALGIQTAVNAGQTVTACADVTDLLGLVRAQTGKHLSEATATKLTTDANNLAAALGC